MTVADKCPYCGMYHSTVCPSVKAYEYFPNGLIKRVEFRDIEHTFVVKKEPAEKKTDESWSSMATERREDRNEQSVFIGGYFTDLVNSGKRPDYGYPSNHLPTPKKSRMSGEPR